MAEFVVKRIYMGVAETEYLGDGQMNRVRMIVMRNLIPGMEIEIYSGPTRYTTRYKGTLYLDNNSKVSFRKGKDVWGVNVNGSLKKTAVRVASPFGL